MTEQFKIIPCPACEHDISVDADSCPNCGHQNAWVHLKILNVIEYLNTLERDTKYEANGHRLILTTQHINFLQKMTGLLLVASVISVLIGMFSPVFMSLGIIGTGLSVVLSIFGLSNTHELIADLHQANPIVSVSDDRFWAKEISILRQ